MKTSEIISVMTAFLVSIAQAQFGHIPPNHYHPGSICYGYAMGRAFGKTSWSNDPGGCDLKTIHPEQTGGIQGSVDSRYFQLSYNINTLKIGDILAFEETFPGSGVFGHVAYVSSAREDGKYDVDLTLLDQVDGFEAQERKNVRLRDVIYGDVPNGIKAHGNPIAKYIKKALWNGTIRNQFSDGSNGGTVKLVIPAEGESHVYSPFSLANRYWGETITVDAEMNGQEVNSVVQIFLSWTRTDGDWSAQTKEAQLPINWPYTQTPEIKATFGGKLVVSGMKTIQAGQTVILDQNTIIDIQANSELVVYGRLVVNGTPSQRLVFAPPSGTTWKGIRFEGTGANNSSLQYCDINYALSPVVIKNGASNITIDNVTIGNSRFDGVSPDWAAAAIAIC